MVQLSASGSVEVQQDLLSISMTTTRDGPDAGTVQNQLKVALDAALAEAKKSALPGQLDVRTGNFSLYPRYARDGKVNGWQGTAELVLEGRDFARISTVAGKVQTLTMGNVMFSLSREQRTKVEGEAQSVAIDRFKAKAETIAKSFGFGGYTLREVSVNANDQGFVPRPRMMAMEAKAASSATLSWFCTVPASGASRVVFMLMLSRSCCTSTEPLAESCTTFCGGIGPFC